MTNENLNLTRGIPKYSPYQIKACCSNCSEQSKILIQFCEAFLCQACLDWLDDEIQDTSNPSAIKL